jgi:hypothetical protein
MQSAPSMTATPKRAKTSLLGFAADGDAAEPQE